MSSIPNESTVPPPFTKETSKDLSTTSVTEAAEGDPPDSPCDRRERRNRHWLFVCSILATFLYGGSYYGWGPMQLVLENAGSYSSKCLPEEDSCQERTQALVNIRLISQMTLLASPIFGEISDRYGAQMVAHLQGGFSVVGALLLVISLYYASDATSNINLDWLLHITFWLFSLSAWASGILIVETGLVFRGRARARVIAALSSTYDSASVTYLGLWGLNQIGSHGSILQDEWFVMALYFAAAVVTFAAFSYFWCTVVPAEEVPTEAAEQPQPADDGRPNLYKGYSFRGDETVLWPSPAAASERKRQKNLEGVGALSVLQEEEPTEEEEDDAVMATELPPPPPPPLPLSTKPTSSVLRLGMDGVLVATNVGEEPSAQPPSASEVEGRTSLMSELSDQQDNFEDKVTLLAVKADLKLSSKNLKTASDKDMKTLLQQHQHLSSKKMLNLDSPLPREGDTLPDDYVLIADRSPMQQLLSEPFLMLCAFYAIQLTANVWVFTTARDFLAYLGDDEYGNRYLSIFTLLGPASLAALPCVDTALNKYGFHAALQAVNVLAIGYSLVKIVSDNLNVQIVGFILFSIYRSFLFSVTLTCLPNIVSRKLVGRSIGIFDMASGLTSFVNIPLANVALDRLDGNFFIPNVLFCAINIPCIFLVWRVGQGLERERLAKEAKSMETQLEDRMQVLQRAQPARLSTFARDSIVTRRRGQGIVPKVTRTQSLRGVPSERRLTGAQDETEHKQPMDRSSV